MFSWRSYDNKCAILPLINPILRLKMNTLAQMFIYTTIKASCLRIKIIKCIIKKDLLNSIYGALSNFIPHESHQNRVINLQNKNISWVIF